MIFRAGPSRLQEAGAARLALARSSGWAMAEYLAYPVLMLAAMPLYLWALGTTQYGQWMLLLTITGFGGLAGLGMGPTATRLIAAARGRGEGADALAGARACLALSLAGAVPLSLLILVLGWTAGAQVFAKVGTAQEIGTIAAFAALLLFLEQIDGVFAGILRGLERFDLSARLEISAKLLQVLSTAVVAWQTRDVVAVFVTGAIIALARTAIKMVAAQRLLSAGWLRPGWMPQHVREAFGFGKWIWLQSAGSLMFAVVDRALVGAMLGADALARYAVALQLAQQVQSVPAAGAQVLFPAVARQQAAGGDWRRLALLCTGLVALIGLSGAVALIVLGDWFLRLWVGEAMAATLAPVLPWLALVYGILAVPTVAQHVLMGTGHARLVAGVTLTAGVAAIAILPWSIDQAGLTGAAAGRIGYAAVTLALVPVMLWTMRQGRMAR